MVISKTVILERLKKLEQCLKRLKTMAQISEADFLGSWRDQDIADRNLQLAAEAVFDFANHIISEKGYEMPTTLEETFPVLQKNGILSENLYQRLQGLGRFRNLIVHEYMTIDYHKIYSYLQTHLVDFEAFAAEIGQFLKKS